MLNPKKDICWMLVFHFDDKQCKKHKMLMVVALRRNERSTSCCCIGV
jgi:hypothetical protein